MQSQTLAFLLQTAHLQMALKYLGTGNAAQFVS